MSFAVKVHAAETFVRGRFGKTSWNLEPSLVDHLDGYGRLQFQTGASEGKTRVIKSGKHRTVYRVELPGGTYFYKHYRSVKWHDTLQNLLRPTKAEREWDGIQTIRRFGVKTVEPVGVGVVDHTGFRGDSFLITREIENTVQLDDLLETASPSEGTLSDRAKIIEELACITATLHNNGFVHRDYHAGNFLVRNVGLRPEVFLLDLHPTFQTKRFRRSHAGQMIGQLNHFLSRFASRADSLRFFDAYWYFLSTSRRELFFPVGSTRDEYVRHLAQICDDVQAQSWLKADRKWRRGNRRLLIHSSSQRHSRCVSMMGKRFLRDLSDCPDRLFEQPFQLEWVKNSDHRKVARVGIPLDSQNVHAYYKMQTLSKFRHAAFSFQGGSHVRQAWEFGHAFLRRGIPTPKPLAFVERNEGPECRHYLLTEAAPNCVALSAFYDVYLHEMPARDANDWLNRHARKFGEVIAKLHAARFDHRDLKSNNMLVANDFSRTEISLLDLDAARRWVVLPQARVTQNLARMNRSTLDCPTVSLTHRLRFLRSYLGSHFQSEWKSYWKRIAKRAVKFTQQSLASDADNRDNQRKAA